MFILAFHRLLRAEVFLHPCYDLFKKKWCNRLRCRHRVTGMIFEKCYYHGIDLK